MFRTSIVQALPEGRGDGTVGTDQRVSNKTEKLLIQSVHLKKFSWAPGRGNPNTGIFRTSIVQALPEGGGGGGDGIWN